jgi:hypothetical protein
MYIVLIPLRKAHLNRNKTCLSFFQVVVYVALLPHVQIFSVIFDSASPNRLMALTFVLKLVAFCLFFGGVFHINSVDFQNQSRDYGTHLYFGKLAMAVFIVYIVITGVKATGYMFRRIFRLRILGSIFKLVVSEWFVAGVDHLSNVSGLLSVLSGITGYLFMYSKEELLHISQESLEDHDASEGWLLRCMCLLLAFLFILLLLANFHKHYINNHEHFITLEDFKNNFLQFQSLYQEEDVMEMGQEMPKVTSALRMI